jgi:hypothetical protein
MARDWRTFDDWDDVSIVILRTCKQLNREGGQVFCGENHFMFQETWDCIHITQMLPLHNSRWLKELTIAIPFVAGYRTFQIDDIDSGNLFPFEDRHVRSKSDRFDLLPNRLLRDLLDALAVASCLKKLNLIIPHYWDHVPDHKPSDYPPPLGDRWFPSINSGNSTFMNSFDAWEDLEVFLRHRTDLKVTVVRL